jgi:hypothetical protein
MRRVRLGPGLSSAHCTDIQTGPPAITPKTGPLHFYCRVDQVTLGWLGVRFFHL